MGCVWHILTTHVTCAALLLGQVEAAASSCDEAAAAEQQPASAESQAAVLVQQYKQWVAQHGSSPPPPAGWQAPRQPPVRLMGQVLQCCRLHAKACGGSTQLLGLAIFRKQQHLSSRTAVLCNRRLRWMCCLCAGFPALLATCISPNTWQLQAIACTCSLQGVNSLLCCCAPLQTGTDAG